MCIKVTGIPDRTYHCCPCHLRRKTTKKMSFQKKNVIQGFMKEDYVPTSEQFVVKYCSGKGNNLHEVECVDGSTLLVSMPKKYRHTVWLKKDDCLVIDPIEEGKKVRGEIMCVLPTDSVRDLITNRQWPSKTDSNIAVNVEALLQFFASSERKSSRDDLGAFPPSDSSSEEEEDEEDDEESDNGDDDEGSEAKGDKEEELDNSQSNDSNEDVDESARDRNRSRVQLVTSGVVTVTNVITEGLGNDIQSLEFEADEESSDEVSHSNRDLERHANTIRIQVNYNNANTCSGATGD